MRHSIASISGGIYSQLATGMDPPTQDQVDQVLEALRFYFRSRSVGTDTQVVFETKWGEFHVRSLATPPGQANCGWCHEVHDIEQIKACRRKAHTVSAEQFAAVRARALVTHEKLAAL